jgi:hypothetical protein
LATLEVVGAPRARVERRVVRMMQVVFILKVGSVVE